MTVGSVARSRVNRVHDVFEERRSARTSSANVLKASNKHRIVASDLTTYSIQDRTGIQEVSLDCARSFGSPDSFVGSSRLSSPQLSFLPTMNPTMLLPWAHIPHDRIETEAHKDGYTPLSSPISSRGSLAQRSAPYSLPQCDRHL